MKYRIFIFIGLLGLVAMIFLSLSDRFQKKPSYAQSVSYPLGVSVIIGGQQGFRLFGYSSPQSIITLDSQGMINQATADSTGYFEFINPLLSNIASEYCLTSQDQFGRLSVPLCLPTLRSRTSISVGPVLMPPTLSLNPSGIAGYFVGDSVILSGQSIPDSPLTLSTFLEEKKSIIASVENVYAVELPQLETKSDKQGNFAIELPSSSVTSYRIFAQSYYQKNAGPKSLTLSVQIIPWWYIIIEFLLFLWKLITAHLLELIFLLELTGLFIYFLRSHFKPHAIVLRKQFSLVKA